MRKLVLLRHGEYDRGDYDLNDRGQEQIRRAAERLRSFVNGSSALIFTSPERRALTGAEIISKTLGLAPATVAEEVGDLYFDSKTLARTTAWLDGLAPNVEVVIVMTHLPIFEDFLPGFILARLGEEALFYPRNGEGCVIDFDAKTFAELRS